MAQEAVRSLAAVATIKNSLFFVASASRTSHSLPNSSDSQNPQVTDNE